MKLVLKIGVVVAVLLGLLFALFVWSVEAVRGSPEKDGFAVYLDHRGRMLEKMREASPLSKEEAERRSEVLTRVLQRAQLLVDGYDPRLAEVVPDYLPRSSLMPNWGPERSLGLARYDDTDPERIERLERDAKVNAAALRFAREDGLLDALLDYASYEGAIVAMEDHEGRPQRVGPPLLLLEFVDALDDGDEARAASAIIAARRLPLAMGAHGDTLGFVQSVMWLRFWNDYVLDSIEFGLMTPTLAETMLKQSTEVEWGVWRRWNAFQAAMDLIEGLVLQREFNGVAVQRIYQEDGRLKREIARRSLAGPVRVQFEDVSDIYDTRLSTHVVTYPRAAPWSRHATADGVAAMLWSFAEQAADVLERPRHERDRELADIEPDKASDILYPGPVIAMFGRFGLMSPEFSDSTEFFDNAMKIVLAIEVYRGEHGGVPGSLDDLVPGVLAELPLNAFAPDGRFRYRADADSPYGYVLYSPDTDGVDHGGRRSPDQHHLPSMPHEGWDYVIVPREVR